MVKKRQQSSYGSRRKKRSLLERAAGVHPAVVFCGVAVILLIVWRLSASGGPVGPSGAATPSDALMEVTVPEGVAVQDVEYTGFKVSYNSDYHQPNYVAWELTKDELNGHVSRQSNFDVDPRVIGSAQLNDYRRSGYDRGHMIPAADVKWSDEAMTASHLLTNICPQDHKLNAGTWATLENNCRKWAERDSAIIIICGPVLTDRMPRSIGEDGRKIPVPERFFKVVLSPYTNPPRGIGFVMNNGAVEGGVQGAAVSIDQVEEITGFDFFAELPDEIENEVEAQCAYHEWQRKKR